MTRVAVVQIGSVPFDAEATTEKIIHRLREAADTGAELAVFPEATLGTYPKGLTFDAPVGRRLPAGKEEFLRYCRAAVNLDGPELERITQAVADTGVFTVLGIIERDGRTLYCTAVYLDPHTGLVGKHRKLMPTGAERLIWGFGDGSTLQTVDTPAGRAGAVICWENYMPMLRTAMYAQGIELYCAPTVDDRDQWQTTMSFIATEGRTHVLTACQVSFVSDFPDDYRNTIETGEDGLLIRGGSAIYSPTGEALAGPVYGREAVLVADLDPDDRIRTAFDFDPVGHYSRPDVFRLEVDTSPKRPVVGLENGAQ